MNLDKRYSCDFHVHSCYSPDSHEDLKSILDAGLEKNLYAIAITDHFVDTAFSDLSANFQILLGPEYQLVKKEEVFLIFEKRGKQIIVIRGKEVSTAGNFHLLALAYCGKIANFEDYRETVKKIKAQGGATIITHPLNISSHGLGKKRLINLAVQEKSPCLIDAVEIFNAEGLLPIFWGDRMAARLAKKYNLSGVTGSDAHGKKYVGHSATIFYEPLDTSSAENFSVSLIRLLRSGQRTYIKKYISPFKVFFFHTWPQIIAWFKGQPVRIKPPANLE